MPQEYLAKTLNDKPSKTGGLRMKMKALIVVDMQNDFITGSLANKNAQAIVKPICEFIKRWKHLIVATRDTHGENYLNTREGMHLPVEHCIKDSAGWCLHDDIRRAIVGKDHVIVDKSTFAAPMGKLAEAMKFMSNDDGDIYVCGTVSEICVVSNALMLISAFPKANVVILEDLCAGITEEGHRAAMEVMKACHCEVVKSCEVITK